MLLKYFFIGGSAALIDWSAFALMVYILKWHFLLAGTISFVMATFANYIIGVSTIFQSGIRFNKKSEVSLIYLISSFGLGISLAVMNILHTWFGIHVMAAKIASSGLTFIWNYSMRAFFVFNSK
jgi:putative flippase GtrA